MAIPFKDLLNELPEEEQQAIAVGTRQLIDEYLTLQDLRKARALTQERMAEMLGINQESISRLEKRSDLLLSTLSSYVTAMGGRLQLVAEFPDRPPVILAGLGAADDAASKPARAGKGNRATLRDATPA
ncbi:XRE family transcriptional regulator [Rhodopila sp.]|uniref:XRE family transcriptional regulator n=1 Tax=Rhodopila sp. TaxID=2480087 RepID=UPI003D10A111